MPRKSTNHRCLVCETAFTAERSDAKFCTQDCRNFYFNRIRENNKKHYLAKNLLNLLEKERTPDTKVMNTLKNYLSDNPVKIPRGLAK